MADYFSLVTVHGADGRDYMRTAPAWVNLEAGEEVMFQTNEHPYEMRGNVVDIAYFRSDEKEYQMIRNFVKDDITLKITKKVIYKAYTYENEAEAEEKGEEANG